MDGHGWRLSLSLFLVSSTGLISDRAALICRHARRLCGDAVFMSSICVVSGSATMLRQRRAIQRHRQRLWRTSLYSLRLHPPAPCHLASLTTRRIYTDAGSYSHSHSLDSVAEMAAASAVVSNVVSMIGTEAGLSEPLRCSYRLTSTNSIRRICRPSLRRTSNLLAVQCLASLCDGLAGYAIRSTTLSQSRNHPPALIHRSPSAHRGFGYIDPQ
jgi:hypothetical protein